MGFSYYIIYVATSNPQHSLMDRNFLSNFISVLRNYNTWGSNWYRHFVFNDTLFTQLEERGFSLVSVIKKTKVRVGKNNNNKNAENRI